VVGTAGHIDHGKSAIVRALTGVDPDRLEEEKRRGMTIDLGFAHFDLPSGRRVGLVDVPGHERLIRNMLAGATGVDLVLLVIAADEGVMPQTREHLDILRFLRVQRGIVILNKVDLTSDPEWLALVMEDIRSLTDGSFLAAAPILSISARTGAGLPALVSAIDDALREIEPRPADAPARMPVDRCFTMAGFGTVVTGTLWSGRIRAGDVLEVLPAGQEVRVRQVQSHGQVVEEARAGQRAALNIVGASKAQIVRGHVLAAPHTLRPTALLDARVRLLPGAAPLSHNSRIRFYVGADEVIGRIRLLDRIRLEPGESAVAQVRLERPTAVARGDPFVIRRYSPIATIGGGEIITTHAELRRRGAAAAQAVVAQEKSGLDEQLAAAMQAAGRSGTTVEALALEAGTTRERVASFVSTWAAERRAIELRSRVFSAAVAQRLEDELQQTLAAYHAATPWRRGMPRDELKVRTFAIGDDRLYSHVLDRLAGGGAIVIEGGFARLARFHPTRSASEMEAGRTIDDAFRRGRYAPPARQEVLAGIEDRPAAERMFHALLDEGILVDVGDDIVFHQDVLREIEAQVRAYIAAHGEITVAALRDRLGSSRKFALTVLEYLDIQRVTRRIGDKRVLARP
jgi:selenocysteine-specific elongation factor